MGLVRDVKKNGDLLFLRRRHYQVRQDIPVHIDPERFGPNPEPVYREWGRAGLVELPVVVQEDIEPGGFYAGRADVGLVIKIRVQRNDADRRPGERRQHGAAELGPGDRGRGRAMTDGKPPRAAGRGDQHERRENKQPFFHP